MVHKSKGVTWFCRFLKLFFAQICYPMHRFVILCSNAYRIMLSYMHCPCAFAYRVMTMVQLTSSILLNQNRYSRSVDSFGHGKLIFQESSSRYLNVKSPLPKPGRQGHSAERKLGERKRSRSFCMLMNLGRKAPLAI